MTNISTCDLFFNRSDLDQNRVEQLVKGVRMPMMAVFLDLSAESIVLDDGRLKSAAFDTTQGFSYAPWQGSDRVCSRFRSEAAIKRAAKVVRSDFKVLAASVRQFKQMQIYMTRQTHLAQYRQNRTISRNGCLCTN